MFINDNRRSTQGVEIGDCQPGAVVEIEDRDGFFFVIDYSSIEGYLYKDEFEGNLEDYSFILNCWNGEFDAVYNYTYCYPLNAKMIIE